MLYLPTIIAMLVKYGPTAIQIAEIYGPPAVKFAQAVWPLIEGEIDKQASTATNVKVALAAVGHPAVDVTAPVAFADRFSQMS